jgi:hypothetical protein
MRVRNVGDSQKTNNDASDLMIMVLRTLSSTDHHAYSVLMCVYLKLNWQKLRVCVCIHWMNVHIHSFFFFFQGFMSCAALTNCATGGALLFLLNILRHIQTYIVLHPARSLINFVCIVYYAFFFFFFFLYVHNRRFVIHIHCSNSKYSSTRAGIKRTISCTK